MKILQIHNSYIYYGGEDSVVSNEKKLLHSKKHTIYQLIRKNNIETKGIFNKIKILFDLSYSKNSYKIIKNKIDKFGIPDIAHIHNLFPLWTYSIIDFLSKKNIPIVMTLHNFRIIWSSFGIFEKEALKYGCYKNSTLKSYFISNIFNQKKKILNKVDKFITHTSFTRNIFINHGIPKDKLIIKPNFIKKNQYKFQKITKKKKIVFASRISKEKGILTLIKAFKGSNLKIDILGDGPLLKKLKNKKYKNINFVGQKSPKVVFKNIRNAKFLIFPSEWYESMPMTIIEAFCAGTLVLASNIGSIKSIIQHKRNGILFEPSNHLDLLNKVNWILNNPKICDQIVMNANKDFNNLYSDKSNYNQLIKIYNETIKSKIKKKN